LRLLPGREVPAPIDLVEVDEVGVCALGPASRGLVELLREHGQRGRNGHALGVEEAIRVFVVQTSGGHPRVRQPRERDVVEHLIPRQVTDGLSGDEGAGDVQVALGVVVRDPGGQPGGRVGDSVERLRVQEHLDGVADPLRIQVTHLFVGALLFGRETVRRRSGGQWREP